MNFTQRLWSLIETTDKKLDETFNRDVHLLSTPFIYDFQVFHTLKYLDPNPRMFRELFSRYHVFPISIIGPFITRGLRFSVENFQPAFGPTYIQKIQIWKGHHKMLPGNFMTYNLVNAASEFKRSSYLPFAMYYATMKAKPLILWEKHKRYISASIHPNPFAVVSLINNYGDIVYLTPFSGILLVKPSHREGITKILDIPLEGSWALSSIIGTDGRKTMFFGPFKTFLPKIEGISELNLSEPTIDYFIGFVVSISKELSTNLKQGNGFIMPIVNGAFHPEIYYLANFGNHTVRRINSVRLRFIEDNLNRFKEFQQSLRWTLEKLAVKFDAKNSLNSKILEKYLDQLEVIVIDNNKLYLRNPMQVLIFEMEGADPKCPWTCTRPLPVSITTGYELERTLNVSLLSIMNDFGVWRMV
ncbi:hypothetical protein [Thermococcus henrietii]|uniref:hypothetical protein n=1 Tax=Thermococcus henrietii TaxID=2016361 RepID=UPI000C0752C9|nr:hypothetical protein [Thermococcus henrietii]